MLIKLLLLVAGAYAVWHFWRQIGTPYRNRDDAKGGRDTAPPRGRPATPGIEDMTKCPSCQTYVGTSAPACGRQDCPRRG
jgi:hypothetical protein